MFRSLCFDLLIICLHCKTVVHNHFYIETIFFKQMASNVVFFENI